MQLGDADDDGGANETGKDPGFSEAGGKHTTTAAAPPPAAAATATAAVSATPSTTATSSTDGSAGKGAAGSGENGAKRASDQTPPTSNTAGSSGAAAYPTAAMRWLSQLRFEESDEELQVALTESKEEAVRTYYMEVLATLMAEQRQCYERRRQELTTATTRAAMKTAEAATRRKEGLRGTPDRMTLVHEEVGTATTTAGPSVTSALSPVAKLLETEHRTRVGLVHAYVEATRQLFVHENMELRVLVKRERGLQEDLQEQVMLQSHRNNSIRSNIAKLRRVLGETITRGERERESKQALEAELQANIAAALDQVP